MSTSFVPHLSDCTGKGRWCMVYASASFRPVLQAAYWSDGLMPEDRNLRIRISRGVAVRGRGMFDSLNSISFGRGVVRVSGIHRDTQHPECCTGCKGWLLRILLAAGRRPRWCCTRWTTRLAGAAARCRTAASLLPTLAKCYRSHGSWKPWHRVVAWRTSYWHSMRFRIW